jgi:hypothetical protein
MPIDPTRWPGLVTVKSEPVPQRAADVVLTGGVDDEFGFALGHGGVNPLQEFLRGSAFVIGESR